MTKQTIKRALAWAQLGLALAAPAAAGSWGNIQPAYNAKNEHATVRVEGGADLGRGWKCYGFADIDATPEDPADFENVYGEARLTRLLGNDISALLEYNGGMGDDTYRLGFQWDPDFGQKNTTSVRATYSDRGPQLGVYTREQLTDRLAGSILTEVNFDEGTVYGELEVGVGLSDRMTLFAQGRGFDGPEGFTMTPVVGLKYGF